MATMSLTPRETSSGLRRPAEPAPSRRNPTKQGSVALPKARGAIPMMNGGRRGGHHRDDLSDPPPTPTREVLREAARVLHERRSMNGAGELADPAAESLAKAIRNRTSLTVQEAHGKDAGGANVAVARQQEIQRLRAKQQSLQKQLNQLLAEGTGKDELHKALTLRLGASQPAAQTDSQISPASSPAKSPRGAGGAAAGGVSSIAGFSMDPLDMMEEKVREANDELGEMIHQCEILAHVETRTRNEKNAAEVELAKLKKMLDALLKEDEEIRVLGEDASEAVRNARRELSFAREALAERRKAYEDLKSQRKTVIAEQKKATERDKAEDDRAKNARLDGVGELDAMNEQQLREADQMNQASKVTTLLEKEAAFEKASKMEEVFNRLRRATHDPESIATPQDLLFTMLSAKERAEELQQGATKAEDLSRELTLEMQSMQAELEQLMFYGGGTSFSQGFAEAEQAIQPGLDAATILMAANRKTCNAARSLVHDSKLGLSLLLHLTLRESPEKLPQDADIPDALDRIERFLVGCINVVTASANKGGGGGGGGGGAGEGGGALEPRPPPFPKPKGGSVHAGHNLRVPTQEETDELLETLPEDEPEGVDDDGTELRLTRRAGSDGYMSPTRLGLGGNKGKGAMGKGKQSGKGKAAGNRGGGSLARAAPS